MTRIFLRSRVTAQLLLSIIICQSVAVHANQIAQPIADPSPQDQSGALTAADSETESSTERSSLPTLSQMQSDTPVIQMEIDRRFNEIREELLDQRASSINSWLTVIALVMTFFGVIAAIAGLIGFSRFRQIETDARDSVRKAASLADQAQRHVRAIEHNRDQSEVIINTLSAQTATEEPENVGQIIKSVRNDPNATFLENAVADALSCVSSGKTNEALRKWHAIAELAQGHDNELAARAWLSVGFLVVPKNLSYSVTANDRAIKLNPSFAGAYLNRGVSKHLLGRHDDAIPDFDEAIRLSPDNAQAYANRGAALSALERHSAAIADYDRAISLQPESPSHYANRGVTKDKMGRHEEAIADHNVAIRLSPGEGEYYSNRGIAKVSARRFEEAIADHDEAIRLGPDRAAFFDNRANAKSALGLLDEALADHNRAIELQPTFAKAYNNRGNVYLAMRQQPNAIHDYDEALRHKPNFPEAYNNRGEAKAALDQHEAAINDYNEALRLNPDLADSFVNRAKSNAAIGKKRHVKHDLTNAIKLARRTNNASVLHEAQRLLDDL